MPDGEEEMYEDDDIYPVPVIDDSQYDTGPETIEDDSDNNGDQNA